MKNFFKNIIKYSKLTFYKIIRNIYKIFLFALFLFLIFTIISNISISNYSKKYLADSIENVDNFKVGLLLGTSKFVKNKNKNEFFFNRIEAAVNLYKSGKIKRIIISGDNSLKSYNEPRDMKKELIKQGVPDSCIYLDYAGFRTLDSIIRAREIFGQHVYIIISQRFHNERAIFLARKNGIAAYGYNAKDVSSYKGFKTKMRELLARDKAILDIIFNVKPKFLGEKIEIK